LKKFLEKIKNLILLASGESFAGFISLLVIPVIISRIGANEYSATLPPMAIALFLISLFDFGITLGLPALWRRQKNKKIQKIYLLTATLIKIIALISSIALLYIVTNNYLDYKNDMAIFGAALMIVGQLLNPLWLNIITNTTVLAQSINAIGRVVPIVIIYFYLEKSDNPGVVNIWIGLGSLISTLIIYVILWNKFKKLIEIKLSFVFESWKFIPILLKRNIQLYVAQLAQTAGRTALPMIASLFLSPVHYLAYSVTEKCLRACQSIQSYFMQYEYSLIIGNLRELNLNTEILLIYRRRIIKISLLIMLSFYFLFPKISFYIFSGNSEAISVSQDLYGYLSFLIIIGGVNYWLGVLGLSLIKKTNILLIGSFFSGLCALMISFSGGMNSNAIQYVAAMFISEIVLMLFVLNSYRK
jgi:PST family polysaccharide transporter